MAQTLSEHLKALSSSGAKADVVLVACTEDGAAKELPSHACILERSPVFRRMTSEPFVESATKRLEIPVCEAKHLEAVRQYLYTDKMDFPGDWSAGDVVEVMALCTKYDLPLALQLAAEALMERLGTMLSADAEQAVERLVVVIDQDALVNEALAAVLQNVTFGRDVTRHLMWLRQLRRRARRPLDAEQTACLRKVTHERSLHAKELAQAHAGADATDIAQARALVSVYFLSRVGLHSARRLSDRTLRREARSCLADGCRHLLEELAGLFDAPAESSASTAKDAEAAGSSPERAVAKKQRLL